MANIIAIANQKGGVGKTTSTIEIAAILASRKKKVLVIDLDQQCNFTKNSGINREKPTIYDLFKSEMPDMENAIQQSQSDGYYVIAGSPQMSKADVEFTDTPDMYLLAELTEALAEEFDYILIDNGPARDKLLNMSYLAADYFIMCIDSGEDSIDGIDAIVSDMMKFHKPGKKELSHAKILGVIMSRYRNTAISKAILQIMEEKIEADDENGIPAVLKTSSVPFVLPVREAAVVDESKMAHTSLQTYKKYSNPAMDYRKIVDAMEEKISKEA